MIVVDADVVDITDGKLTVTDVDGDDELNSIVLIIFENIRIVYRRFEKIL